MFYFVFCFHFAFLVLFHFILRQGLPINHKLA